MQQTDVLDLHITAVMTWFVQLIGRALLVAAILPLVVGGVLVAAGAVELAVLVAVVGFPAVFAWQLMGAEAPLPVEVEGE